MSIVYENYWDEGYCKDPLGELVGKTICSVKGGDVGDYETIIETECGFVVKLYHEQDCCETVDIADVDGDLRDLVGGIVISAEEVTNANWYPPEYPDSYTWTFYKIETTKGGVTLRWLGESNGYYSESVNVVAGRRVN